MRGRTLILFAIALVLAGGTAILVRSRLAQPSRVAAAEPPPKPAPQKSVLVARAAIARGQILKPTDFTARPWPETALTSDYVIAGGGPEKSLAGAVARAPFVAGEPIIKAKIVMPGDRGFLAAVLQPGMRAVSVPVSAASAVSGFVFPGDRVDVLITLPLPAGRPYRAGDQHKAAETVLRNLLVLAIGQRLDSKGGQAILAATATLEVTPKQCEAIALAEDMGKLSLSLRSLKTREPAGESAGESAVELAADQHPDSVTIDSQLLPKPLITKQNLGDDLVTILRGNGSNGTSVASQPAPRGS